METLVPGLSDDRINPNEVDVFWKLTVQSETTNDRDEMFGCMVNCPPATTVITQFDTRAVCVLAPDVLASKPAQENVLSRTILLPPEQL